MATPQVRYQALGPVLSGEGSRAFLGLEIQQTGAARPVVLVWVPDEATQKPEVIEALRRETARAATLEHPNILKVFELASLDEGYARVVEFADGESLRQLLAVAKQLPPRLAARLVADVAMGVHYAHVAGNDDGSPLVHGDLRPETVIVSFKGVAKVSGYGALNVAPKELYGNRVIGRRAHCAPEQIIGGRSNIVPSTDVYLLGLMLYECINGALPFAAGADFDQAVLTQPPAPLTSPEVPEALWAVLEKALAKRTHERFATPLELREALQQAMEPLPEPAELAAFLTQHFPESHPSRAARRREIDTGIADLVRRQWAAAAAADTRKPLAHAPASPPPEEPRLTVVRAPAPVEEEEEEEEEEEDEAPSPRPGLARRAAVPVAVAAALLLAAVALVGRTPSAPTVPAPAISAPATAPAEPAAPAREPIPEPKPAPAPSALSLFVEPAVEVTIAGRSYGKTPLETPLPPGRHVLQLSNERLGIDTARSVTVAPEGKTREQIYLGRGYVTVTAPAGAKIFVDGRSRGTAPLSKELSVYEGKHRIVVTVGAAKWQQPFSLRAGERMYFNVEFQ